MTDYQSIVTRGLFPTEPQTQAEANELVLSTGLLASDEDTTEADLQIEVAAAEADLRSSLSEADQAKLQPPNPPRHQVNSTGAAFIQPPAPEVETASTTEDRIKTLLDSATYIDNKVDELMEQLKKICKPLTFTVPKDQQEVRAAMVTLGMESDQVSYDDYVELLKLQLKLSHDAAAEMSPTL